MRPSRVLPAAALGAALLPFISVGCGSLLGLEDGKLRPESASGGTPGTGGSATSPDASAGGAVDAGSGGTIGTGGAGTGGTQNTGGTIADAGPGDAALPTVYGALSDQERWSTFELGNTLSLNVGYNGGVFDGRYVVLAPYTNFLTGGTTSVAARYDTHAPFAGATSWTTMDLSTATTQSYPWGSAGAVFDGRYVHFVPYAATDAVTYTYFSGPVFRYDSKAAFDVPASFSAFAMSTANAGAMGYLGGTFDGQYVYFAPYYNGTAGYHGVAARYDTKKDFAAAASREFFDIQTKTPGAAGYEGAAFDGQYVYFVPNVNSVAHGIVARFDTTRKFTDAPAWSTFDLSTLNVNAKGYAGAVFDGRYLYLVPGVSSPGSLVARLDTKASFVTGTSWVLFDASTLAGNAHGFNGGGFDGRYVYLAPYATGLVVRYDSTAAYGAQASWETYPLGAINRNASAFHGIVFDGEYLYFVPANNNVVARFHARTPRSTPPMNGGSFY